MVNTAGDLFSVESADQIFEFTNANEFQDLVDHIEGVIQVSLIDSHQHLNSNGGGNFIMANDPREAIIEYASCLLKNQSLTLDLGSTE